MRTGSIASIVAGCVLATCVLTTAASAQECGSVSTPEDLAAFLANLNAGVYEPMPAPEAALRVGVAFHVVRWSNGTGGINEAQLVRAIDDANLHFANAGIGFCWNSAIDYIDDDGFMTIESWAELDALRAVNVVPNAINIYTVDRIFINNQAWCGFSSFSWSAVQGIVMDADCTGSQTDRTTFSHELGHYFDLWHTHEDHGGRLPECVACCNCNTAGDYLCDTPADPRLNRVGMLFGCTYVGTVLDPCNNDPYHPDVANLMSYSFECRRFFSNQQNFRMRATLERLRPDHLVPCSGQNVWRPGGKFVADDGAMLDWFGVSVSLSGDRALVGAFLDDDRGASSGSAYVFDRVGGVWVQSAKLTANDGAEGDYFGYSVSLSADRALVAAQGDDDRGTDSGSAYVFDKVGGAWVQTAKILASDGAAGDQFGSSVSLSGDRTLVGAAFDDDRATNTGSAYVFDKVGGVWLQTAKILAQDGAAGDRFGSSVSLSGDRTLVGAAFDDDRGTNSGSAYVFDRVGGAWVQTAKILANDGAPGDIFGFSVSLSGGRALLGAAGDDDLGTNSGSAYVFDFVPAINAWVQQPKILANDGAARDQFGTSVSLFGDRALVGAPLDDDRGGGSGSAYVFEKTGGLWAQTAKLLAPDGAADDYFGYSVSLSADRALVAAPADDDRGTDSGSAYVFDDLNQLRFCYPDCDQSTGPGILDIFDFLCFQNSFVSGEPYACDCDTSTGPLVCDIFDFLCFQNAFVSGCP